MIIADLEHIEVIAPVEVSGAASLLNGLPIVSGKSITSMSSILRSFVPRTSTLGALPSPSTVNFITTNVATLTPTAQTTGGLATNVITLGQGNLAAWVGGVQIG